MRKFFRTVWLPKINRYLQKLFVSLRKIELPGFEGMGLYDVLRFFVNGLMDSKFTLIASAMSYQFFFSLFPALLLAFLIFPYIPIEGIEENTLRFIMQFLPIGGDDALGQGQKGIEAMVEDIVTHYFEGRSSFMLIIVSVSLALWGATRGIIAMMKAFTKNEEVFKKRNIFQLYGMALLIFFILGMLIMTAVVGIILINQGISYLQEINILGDVWAGILGQATLIIFTAATVFFGISTLYYLAPATHERWKFFSPGSVGAGVLMLVAIVGLRYFFSNFANFDRLYGSLGAIILLMVWFYYISIMLLIGFELNAAIDMAAYHDEKAQTEQDQAVGHA
ncbi:MAG: YihY/virulence factor BrkB family protein [Bacteroidia bacterium]|nr:YihY/virulence factor BrkB family protein [Bacteroidia bacterium]